MNLDNFNKIDWLEFLIYLAKNKLESIPTQLKLDLANNICQIKAEFVKSLGISMLETKLMINNLYANVEGNSFIDNLYYVKQDESLLYQLEDTLLNQESLTEYWGNIEFTKLLKLYINRDM